MIGFLRSIAAIDWRADQKTLMHLYKLYIRSQIDYGFIIYQSAIRTTEELIDPITTECLLIASGAFKSTPIESINAIYHKLNATRFKKRSTDFKIFFQNQKSFC